MSDAHDQPPSGLAEETERLRKTVATLVRQQEEHMEWLKSLDERMRAARDSMLLLDQGSGS